MQLMAKSVFDNNYQNENTGGRIVAALERVSQAFRVLLWNEGKEFSLSPIQIQVLVFLLHHEAGKGKVGLLADEFNMTKATISDTVKSLEEKKLIRKAADSADSRSYSIHLSAKGKKVAEKASLFASELLKPVGLMNENEQSDLLLSLLQIIRHLNKAGIITVQRMCFSCSHYSVDKNGHHFCSLLNTQLETSGLRIDCPEHMLQA
jgi:DNA-binding MarR family transcriptional regulator